MWKNFERDSLHWAKAVTRTQAGGRDEKMSDEAPQDPKEMLEKAAHPKCAAAWELYERCAVRIEKKGSGDCAGYYVSSHATSSRRACAAENVATLSQQLTLMFHLLPLLLRAHTQADYFHCLDNNTKSKLLEKTA